MSNDELIRQATGVLNPYTTKDGRLFGDVGAAVLTKNGNVFVGVCIDAPSWGICAERSAIAAMVTAKEYVIDRIVAVWRDPKTDKLHVLPPCGHCREFMRAVDEVNLDTKVLLGRNEFKTVADLIPNHEWPKPLE